MSSSHPFPSPQSGALGGHGTAPHRPAAQVNHFAPPQVPSPPYARQPPGGAGYGWPLPDVPPASGRTNGRAIASLVLATASAAGLGLASTVPWTVDTYWLGSLLALVLALLAMRQIRQRGDSGGRLATAATVLGGIGVASFVATMVFGVIVYLVAVQLAGSGALDECIAHAGLSDQGSSEPCFDSGDLSSSP